MMIAAGQVAKIVSAMMLHMVITKSAPHLPLMAVASILFIPGAMMSIATRFLITAQSNVSEIIATSLAASAMEITVAVPGLFKTVCEVRQLEKKLLETRTLGARCERCKTHYHETFQELTLKRRELEVKATDWINDQVLECLAVTITNCCQL